MDFLPDTNIVIDLFNGDEDIKRFIKSNLASGEMFLSPIVVAEIRPRTSPKEEQGLHNFILSLTVISVDIDIAFQASKYRAQFSHKTKKVYLLDCLIAATCKINNLTLVTNNIKDYPMKDIKILRPS